MSPPKKTKETSKNHLFSSSLAHGIIFSHSNINTEFRNKHRVVKENFQSVGNE